MDILSSILQQNQFSGGVYFCSSYVSDWGFDISKTNTGAFHILVEGNATVGFEDQILELKAGDIIAFPNGHAHWISYHKNSSRKPFLKSQSSNQLLDYEAKLLKATLLCGYFKIENKLFSAPYFNLPNYIHLAKDSDLYNQWLAAMVKKMNQEVLSNELGSELSVNRQTELIFIELVRHWLKQSHFDQNLLLAMQDPVVANVLALFHQSPEKNYKLELIANQVGVSRSTLNNSFKEILGIAPMSYLTNLRIHQAKNLLKNTHQSLLDIAISVGYLSDSALSKKFKAATGIAPGEYRKRHNSSKGLVKRKNGGRSCLLPL